MKEDISTGFRDIKPKDLQASKTESIKQKKARYKSGLFMDMAESEGFEPPEGLTLRLISSQVHSTGLCQLSLRDAHINDLQTLCKPLSANKLHFFVRLLIFSTL